MSATRPQAPSTPRARGPLSRPLDVRKIPDEGLDLSIEATPAECAAIAASAALVAVNQLSARLRIDRRSGERVVVRGDVGAQIVQVCVVSLEPFESAVTQPIDMTFAPVAEERGPRERGWRDEPAARERVVPVQALGDDDHDPPDPIIDDSIDLGAVALEFLMLSLDPYPRKPGVHFEDVVIGDTDEAKPSAFAALERLKDRS